MTPTSLVYCICIFGISLLSCASKPPYFEELEKAYRLQDAGNHKEAITTLLALKQHYPDSTTLSAELAFSYLELQDYKNCIYYGKHAQADTSNSGLSAILSLGTAYSAIDSIEASIRVLEDGFKRYPKDPILPYNLAVNYYQTQAYAKAVPVLEHAIRDSSYHAGTHLLYAYCAKELGNPIPAIYALWMFGLLEPNSPRTTEALQTLFATMNGRIATESIQKGNVGILVDPKSEFMQSEALLSMAEAKQLEYATQGATEDERFILFATEFFRTVYSVREQPNHLVHTVYSPFFNALAEKKHIQTLYYYITQSVNPAAAKWISTHKAELDALAQEIDLN